MGQRYRRGGDELDQRLMRHADGIIGDSGSKQVGY